MSSLTTLLTSLSNQSFCRLLQSCTTFSSAVRVDPNNLLQPDMQSSFRSLLSDFDSVFDPTIQGYNGAVGPFEDNVNMGPVEPQRKGRLLQYARNKLVNLQSNFDELEKLGVFKRPEDINVAMEYLNTSFLFKKSNGGYRLVTAFADMGRYSKPQPSLTPDVDSTLRQIAQGRHIITNDLTSALYQIPLARESMKYCRVATPFRGVRVYARLAMCMPGSETALEELVSCTWRPYSRRSCCQDRRRSILRSRLTKGVTAQLETSAPGPLQVQPQTLRFHKCHQLQIYSDLGLDLGLWHPQGLPASNCSPSVLQQARNGSSSKVLHWCVQSPGSRYSPVLRLTITTRHCRRRSPGSRED